MWSVGYQENHSNYFHQMSQFKAKMHRGPGALVCSLY